MTPLRAVLILCSVLILSACGSSSESSQSADEQQTTTAAIESIDEPADPAIVDVTALAGDPTSCNQEPQDLREDCRRHLRVLIRTYQPAKGTEPRAIARSRRSTC
jgi:major membrane immunogen (membrane-anchored lipoprotein)